MNYFKNVELASKFNISESTVRNWVKLAKSGKLELALSEDRGRTYVANIPSNIPAIERLVAENRKYRNSLAAKTVSPRPEFYKLFTQAQIYDIVRNLEIHHEIPRQYNYFDGGAEAWDAYTQRLARDEGPNLLNQTVALLKEVQVYLDSRLSNYKRINVVDVGVGNAYPVKNFLTYLIEREKLGRYIALDISDSMLDIAQKNINAWFGNKVNFERYELDITFERFANILAEDYLSQRVNDTVNLVLFLGGTADNLRTPADAFRTINESMNPHDLLIYTDKIETEGIPPQWFSHYAKPGKLSIAPIHRLVFDLLNIDDSLYDVEMGFDPHSCQGYTRAKFKVALTLDFEFEDGGRTVELEKGDAILLWRSWEMTANRVAEQLSTNGFYQLHMSQTEDHEFILAVAEVKS